MAVVSILTDFGKLEWLALILCLIAARLILVYFTTIKYPANLPRVGEKEGATRFRLSTRLRFFTDAQRLQKEAYEKYTKHGRAVLMPGLGFRDEILLPHSSLRWLANQPESQISMYANFRELDQIPSNMPDDRYIMNSWSGLLLKKDMTNNLDNVMIGLNDEIGYAFDWRFGTNTKSWREITVADTMRLMVAEASSRFTVGVPLCRNQDYLDVTSAWVSGFINNAGICGMLPKILQPIAQRIAYIPQHFRLQKLRGFIKPLYEERMKYLSKPKSADEPEDHFQLMLRYSREHEPEEFNLYHLSNRVAILALGAYHQTYMAASNIVLNIVASDAEYNTISELRSEIAKVLAKHDGKWTRVSAADMWKIDSICRETLRIQQFGGRALLRRVTGKGGVMFEDGVRLPEGATVSIPSWSGQTDGDNFENPMKFDPFRYSRIREEAAKNASSADHKDEKSTAAPLSFVTTGVNFLPFGHGKNACPGRFLVDVELKMIVGYLVTHYDLKWPAEYNGVRPESKWMAEACMPPADGKIMVKRREKV